MNASKYSKENFLQKLYNRQVFGQFVRGVSLQYEPTRQLFPKVPDNLIFNLCDTIPNVGNHILMGATRCGRILLTYTFSVDSYTEFAPTLIYRYRLHFWLFRLGFKAVKIAEVQLFDGVQVTEMLTIGIVQWPHDNNRLLVFGSCQELRCMDSWESEAERKSSVYITLTVLPSIRGCEKCKLVAASFGEEEMAANWDAGVGLSCFHHGLTVHTHFTAPSVYALDPDICLASDGRIVFNTGSFLHVLSMGIEHGVDAKQTEQIKDEEITLNNRLNYSFLEDRGYSISLNEDWACNMTQLLIKKICEGFPIEMSQLPFCLKYAMQVHLNYRNALRCKSTKGVDFMCCADWAMLKLTDIKRPTKPKYFSKSDYYGIGRPKPPKRSSDNVYDFMESEEMWCEPKFKLFRRRCLADKMYEFRSEEDLGTIGKEGNENIHPAEVPTEKIENFVSISKSKKCVENSHCKKSVDKKNSELNTTVKAIIADWDLGSAEVETEGEKQEKAVTGFLSGLTNRRLTEKLDGFDSISKPKKCVDNPICKKPTDKKNSDPSIPVKRIVEDWDHGADEMETEAEKREKTVTGFLSGLTNRHFRKSKSWSPLKPHNKRFSVENIRGHFKMTNFRYRRQPPQFELSDEMRKEMDQGFGHQLVTDCSVNFTRRYVEIDQEVSSTITDIEDDDIGPGFHCALPISAHGSSYSQMEMISNHKAEKLTCATAVVRQSSLDIETFCSKAAEAVCRMEGYKFWFFSDYDTEIVRVCHTSGDVLGVLFIRLNAEYYQAALKDRADLRNFYETCCLYIWKPSTGNTYLEGYKGLKRVPRVISKPWCPAGKEAKSLRQGTTSFVPAPSPRLFLHTVKEGMPTLPVNLIIDHDNLIGFRRLPLNSTSL